MDIEEGDFIFIYLSGLMVFIGILLFFEEHLLIMG